MKDQPTSESRATAGKPGESTAEKTDPKSLTTAGVASLLKSGFAADESEEQPAGQEDPPAGDPEASGDEPAPEEVQPEPGDEPADGGEGESEEAPASEGEEQAGDEQPGEGDELPPEMQDALTAWEAKGGPLPEPLQKVVNKRIGRLTSEREAEKQRADQAETALKQAQAEAEALRNDPNRPAHAPAASVMDEQALVKVEKASSQFLTEAENFLDGTATDEESDRIQKYMATERLDEKGLRRRIREINEFRTVELPKQRDAVKQFKALEAQMEPEAKKYFGRMDDKSTEEYREAEAIQRLVPELRQRSPGHKVAQGTYVLGLKALRILQAAGVEADAFGAVETALKKAFPAKGTAPKPAAAKTPPPKSPATVGAAPGRVAARPKPSDAVRQNFSKAPTRENATNLARAALAEV